MYDRDEPGYRHAWKVKASLKRAGVGRVRFARARKGKDLADHLDAGYRLDQLVMVFPPPVEVEADPLGEGVAAAVAEGEPPPAMFQLVLAKLRERAAELRHKPPVEQPDGNWKRRARRTMTRSPACRWGWALTGRLSSTASEDARRERWSRRWVSDGRSSRQRRHVWRTVSAGASRSSRRSDGLRRRTSGNRNGHPWRV